MDTVPALRLPELSAEIAALAARHKRANGPVMTLVNRLGGSLESQMSALPPNLRAQIERVTVRALDAAYGLSAQVARVPSVGQNGPIFAAMATGAAGGAGGIATSLLELPVTITVILHAIRAAAVEAGFDPDETWIKAECLKVFSAGSPLATDDGVNTSFLSARMTVTGPALQKIISTVAPKLAAAMGQKLAAQSVPVLGALSGAAMNAAFVSYYRETARIRFALLRLAILHGAEPVIAAFTAEVTPARVTKA